MNRQDTSVRFAQVASRQAISLVLTPGGSRAGGPGEPLTRPLPDSAWLGSPRIHRVRPGGDALWVYCEVRSAFGVLEPGAYTIQVELDSSGYLTDAPDFEPRVLRSPPFGFVVRAGSLDEARAGNERIEGLELAPLEREGRKLVGLTNRTSRSVRYGSYGALVEGGPEFGLLRLNRWDGESWGDPVGLVCGTGLEHSWLKPGATQLFESPRYFTGITRLRLDVQFEDGTQVSATSEAFASVGDGWPY